MKYIDCPSEGQPRGWKLIVSKNYGLFNAPSDQFATGDRLAGVTGTFLYKATTDEA